MPVLSRPLARWVLSCLLAVAALAVLGPVRPGVASAACASVTTRSVTGTVTGQDGLDVNASIGFDVLNAANQHLDANPHSPTYGCPRAGGYSIPQRELNHFVSGHGVAPGSRQADGSRTVRAVGIFSLPSNATQVWIEVYSRGYTGSPCRDAQGNYCFNYPDLSKYGDANRQKVPPGTHGLALRLPMTCGYHGTDGAITGRAYTSSGTPVTLSGVNAWTTALWNRAPALQGWGMADRISGNSFHIAALAAGQSYTVEATSTRGQTVRRLFVPVSSCRSTPVTIRF